MPGLKKKREKLQNTRIIKSIRIEGFLGKWGKEGETKIAAKTLNNIISKMGNIGEIFQKIWMFIQNK